MGKKARFGRLVTISKMYVYAASSDCLDFFPENKPSHFYIKLPFSVSSELYSKCAITELSFPSLTEKSEIENVYVITNFVVQSYVGYRQLPVMYRTFLGKENTYTFSTGRPYYVKLKNIETDVLEVQIIDGTSFDEIDVSLGSIHCTFHFLDIE